ncbi:hypothetical protein M4D79_10280 [Mycolicibacterium novocastrense]|nr:hypothetical protein M4D79_10280 [Mycolicibacterium novocastrense]
MTRDVFGDQIADLTGPLLKLAVDSAYYGGNPIPRDPSAYRPARLAPPPDELLATAAKVPGAILQGLSAATSPRPSVQQQEASVHSEPTGGERRTMTTKTQQTKPDPVPKRRPLLNVTRDSVKAEPGKVSEQADTGSKDDQPQVDSVGTTHGTQLGTQTHTETDPVGADTDGAGESADPGANAAA